MTRELKPQSHAEAVALFRASMVAHLVSQEFQHGELRAELRRLSDLRLRAPGSTRLRSYGVSTLERWYYAFKNGGLDALKPSRRRDAGHARALTEAQRALLCDIRREHPSASAEVILRTLVFDGRLEDGQVSAATVRRLFREAGLDRVTLSQLAQDGRARRRWEAARPGWLWHADVCHGPSLRTADGSRLPLRIHAILDDASRYVVAIMATSNEREVEMLELWVRALRSLGAGPRTLYLDNGSTYSGETLLTACGRLDVSLVHARPYDPQARGKMERFWRTMRGGCLDHLGQVASLHDVQVRLLAWIDQHYHAAPHAGLMGKTPAQVWADRDLLPVSEERLQAALVTEARRRVRKDCTLSVGGVEWETDAGFLAGRVVRVARSLAEPTAAPWLVHEGRKLRLRQVDPKANGTRPRKEFTPKPGVDAVAFDPAGALLDRYLGRKPRHEREDGR
jgi:putative transposase